MIDCIFMIEFVDLSHLNLQFWDPRYGRLPYSCQIIAYSLCLLPKNTVLPKGQERKGREGAASCYGTIMLSNSSEVSYSSYNSQFGIRIGLILVYWLLRSCVNLKGLYLKRIWIHDPEFSFLNHKLYWTYYLARLDKFKDYKEEAYKLIK